MIDTVSNLVELVRIDDKTSAHIAKKYAQVWLSRHPWPAQCIHDNGGKNISTCYGEGDAAFPGKKKNKHAAFEITVCPWSDTFVNHDSLVGLVSHDNIKGHIHTMGHLFVRIFLREKKKKKE